jgi:hypothetical protein
LYPTDIGKRKRRKRRRKRHGKREGRKEKEKQKGKERKSQINRVSIPILGVLERVDNRAQNPYLSINCI